MSVQKDELLYQLVKHGNIDGITTLRSEGAGLEWVDSQGKTALIAASMDPALYGVVKTLIELGADVDAYRPGPHAGTPLHHAAERGLEQTVQLLLSSGASALILNDDSQTALDIAIDKGYSKIVRKIESHVSLFVGWLKQIQWFTTYRWVVILPRASRVLGRPLKLELLIYNGLEDARPRKIVPLSKANFEEPIFSQRNPTVTISEDSTSTRIKFAPAWKDKKEHLKWFCDACKGIHPVMLLLLPANNQAPTPNIEDIELAMAISASLQETQSINVASPTIENLSPASVPSAPPISDDCTTLHQQSDHDIQEEVDSTIHENLSSIFVPSAPPVSDTADKACCVICLDSPVEGACIPCGHMVGCMSCLNEIKAEELGCPLCRAVIDQVTRIYYAV